MDCEKASAAKLASELNEVNNVENRVDEIGNQRTKFKAVFLCEDKGVYIDLGGDPGPS